MNRFRAIAVLALASALALAAWGPAPSAEAAGRWARPPKGRQAAPLPRLAEPLVLDGDLKEWSAAASVPVRNRSCLILEKEGHAWKGDADAGMEVLAAWNDAGVCLAAVVADNEILNTREDGSLWQQDCIELYLDGRAADRFLKWPYSPGAYQMFVRPPTAGREPALAVNTRDGTIEGLRIAGKTTKTGYVVEMLIPWTAVPAIEPKAGARIGLQFELDDYDSRDGEENQPRKLTCGAARNVWSDPRTFLAWTLVDEAPSGPRAPLSPTVAVDAAAVFTSEKAMPVAVDVGRSLAAKVGSIDLAVMDAGGQAVWQKTVKPKSARGPWSDSVGASTAWPTKGAADGYYAVGVTLHGADGGTLGTASRHVLLFRRTMDEVLARVKKVDLGAVVAADPLRAAGYLGAGATVETLKRSVRSLDRDAAAHAAWEVETRLGLLEGGAAAEDAGFLDLLRLGADPAAEVVVQYASPWSASVRFQCGAVPFAAADVTLLETADEVKDAFAPRADAVLESPSLPVTVGGMPGRFTPLVLDFELADRDCFDPASQVLLLMPARKVGSALRAGAISCARVDAVVVLADCPRPLRETVEAWAADARVPLVDLEAGLKQPRVLVAGDWRQGDGIPEETQKALKALEFYVVRPSAMAGELRVLAGNRLIRTACGSPQVAEQVVRLVAACKPVTAEAADALRAQLVRDVAPRLPEAEPPEGTHLLVGDVHMHTDYSDGRGSPAGLMLQAMHCRMDFAVLTDHNTLDGALEAQHLRGKARFAFPLVVGEEITASAWHMNAYPLRSLIPWDLSPYETVKAARAQGAAIQWNHPGFPGDDWQVAHMEAGLASTGTDAWEHVPFDYDAWKRDGTCPLLVGSSDTHNGTFPDGESTLLFATSPQGEDVAEAVRWGRAVAVEPTFAHLFYGPDAMLAPAWAALAESKALRAASAARLKAALEKADLYALIRASPDKPVPPKKK